MQKVQVLSLIDEFSFEQDEVEVEPTTAALRLIEDVVLVQDASCEYVVTMDGFRLILWDPELSFADQQTIQFDGTLSEALDYALSWLRDYLPIPLELIQPVLDPALFYEAIPHA